MKLTALTLVAAIAATGANAGGGSGRVGTDAEFGQLSPLERLEKLSKEGQLQLAVLCFSTGERISGMNKICYYDCLGSAAAITIKSYALCPLSING